MVCTMFTKCFQKHYAHNSAIVLYLIVLFDYMYYLFSTIDVRQLPKVSLSPQRKSFHGGCSWNESKAPSSAPAFSKDLSKFDFESPYPPTSKYNQGSFQQSDTPSTKHKVIDHIPLRDQKLDRGDKKNWRDRGKEPEWARDNVSHCLFTCDKNYYTN